MCAKISQCTYIWVVQLGVTKEPHDMTVYTIQFMTTNMYTVQTQPRVEWVAMFSFFVAWQGAVELLPSLVFWMHNSLSGPLFAKSITKLQGSYSRTSTERENSWINMDLKNCFCTTILRATVIRVNKNATNSGKALLRVTLHIHSALQICADIGIPESVYRHRPWTIRPSVVPFALRKLRWHWWY